MPRSALGQPWRSSKLNDCVSELGDMFQSDQSEAGVTVHVEQSSTARVSNLAECSPSTLHLPCPTIEILRSSPLV